MKLTDEQIATELRALRPTPSERFSAELDAWAAEGFPSAGQLRSDKPSAAAGGAPPRLAGLRERIRGFRERPLLPALAGAATIVLAVTVAVGVYQTTDEENLDGRIPDSIPESASDQQTGAVTKEAAPNSGAAGDSAGSLGTIEPAPTTVPPIPPQEQLKPGQERIQERSASMTLSADPDEVAEVADGVVEVTERYDGIVVSSNLSTGGDKGRATFDLRIPTQNLQAALADLSDLASVASRDEGTLDITAPFVTAEERFDDAKAEVDALLDQLAEADSATEIASIREQLQIARGELAAARAELGTLKQRADFSRLSITVTANGDADGWSLGDAVDDALSVLEDIAGATLIALAVLIPLGALAALIGFGVRALRRRRTEKLLDK